MGYRSTADLLVVVHLAFIVFVLLGGLLVWRWRHLAWLHLPAVLLELNGWLCPLTPWEQQLRMAAGEAGYTGGFVTHYLLPVLYPAGLQRDMQVVLAAVVIACNALAYGVLLCRARRAG